MTKKVGTCKHCLGHAFDFDRPVKQWKGARATFMLIDGTFMDLTICEVCLGGKMDLDVIWKNVMKSWKEELMMAVDRKEQSNIEGRIKHLTYHGGQNFILSHLCSPSWIDAIGEDQPLKLGW